MFELTAVIPSLHSIRSDNIHHMTPPPPPPPQLLSPWCHDISQLCPGFPMSQPRRSAGHISAMLRLPNVPAKPVCRTYLSYAPASQGPSHAGLQDISQLCCGFPMSQPSRSAGHISAMLRLPNVPAKPVCRTYLSYALASQCPSQASLQDISQLCAGFPMSQPRRSAGHISAMLRLPNVPAKPVCRTYLSYAAASQCPSQAGLQDISQLCPGFPMSQPSQSAGHISAMPRLPNVPTTPVCRTYLSYAPASQCLSHAGLQDVSQLCPGFPMSQPSRSAGHISAMPRLPNVPAKPVCRTYLSYAPASQQGWNSQFCFWSWRIYNGGRICYIKNHGLIVFTLSYTPWLLCHGFVDE